MLDTEARELADQLQNAISAFEQRQRSARMTQHQAADYYRLRGAEELLRIYAARGENMQRAVNELITSAATLAPPAERSPE